MWGGGALVEEGVMLTVKQFRNLTEFLKLKGERGFEVTCKEIFWLHFKEAVL